MPRLEETTAILTLIKEESDEYFGYLAMVSYEGLESLPPFLPLLKTASVRHNKERLEGWLRKFAKEVRFEQQPDHLNRLHHIGEFIYKYLGLRQVFDLLFTQSIANLIVVTNDPTVPWMWAYDGKEFLCERFAYGKIFMEDVKDTFQRQTQRLHRKPDLDEREKFANIDQHLMSKCALILAGSWTPQSPYKQEMDYRQKEIRGVEEQFNRKLGEVRSIWDNPIEFYDFLEEKSPRLKLLHYSGHMDDGEIILAHQDSISPKAIRDAIPDVNFEAKPIVFLNACTSGEIKDLWKKDASLVTSFIEKGATNCVVTCMPVTDRVAYQFAGSFYRKIIDDNDTVGNALRIVRLEQAEDETLKNDLSRLFFDHYGDPRVRLAPIISLTEAMGSRARKAPVVGFDEVYKR